MTVFTSMVITIFYTTTFTTLLDNVDLHMLVCFIAALLVLYTSFFFYFIVMQLQLYAFSPHPCYSPLCPDAYHSPWKILTMKSMFPRGVYYEIYILVNCLI